MIAEIVDNKGITKVMEGIEKTFYYAIALTAVAQAKVKAFASPDGTYGSNGEKTNWESSESKLPSGYAFNVLKLGFIVRNSDGSVLAPADLGKLPLGSFMFKIAEKEKRSGLLAEFFDSAIKLTDDTVDGHQEMPVRSFIPFLSDEGEWIHDESFDYSVSLPAINTTMQLIVCMKGILYKPL